VNLKSTRLILMAAVLLVIILNDTLSLELTQLTINNLLWASGIYVGGRTVTDVLGK